MLASGRVLHVPEQRQSGAETEIPLLEESDNISKQMGGRQGESWLLAGFVTSPANTKLEHEDSAQETAGSRDSACVNDTGKEREDYLSKRLGGLFFQTEHLFPSPNSSWSSRGAPGPPTGLFSPSVALPGC